MYTANKIKLGAFLVITGSLMIAGFLAVGIAKLFEPRYRAMTVLNTSVEGLAIGSPVKYLGLPVGKVTAMAMRESDGFIAVYFDIFPSAVESDSGTNYIFQGGDDINQLLKRKNLMCFLNAAGLMGGSYLELSISDSSQPALPHLDIKPSEDDIAYIPSRPSHIGNAIQNISRMLDELSKVNIIQLADKLNETLDSTSDILTQSNLRETLKSVNAICINLEKSISRLQIVLSEANVTKLNRAIDNADTGMTSLRKVLDKEDLPGLIDNMNRFLTEARGAISSAQTQGRMLSSDAVALKLRLEMSLTRFDNLLKQLTQSAEAISADPNQFIRGRQEPHVLKEK